MDGEAYHWAGSGASAAFDENNILHVAYYTKETAAEDHIRDCVSFGPALIVDGKPEYDPYMESGINPRTAIGQREDGALLLLVLDGRSINTLGATMEDVVNIMLEYGAVNAGNLDGGSSSVMVYGGEIINHCASVTGPRRIPTGFIVLEEGAAYE